MTTSPQGWFRKLPSYPDMTRAGIISEAARINDATELDDEPDIIDDDYVNSLIVASY
jgi:hypothetical protein